MSLISLIILAVLVFMVFKFLIGGKSMTSQNQVIEKIKQGAKIIDVRSAGEYAGGHYNNAVNIPVDQLQNRIKEVGSDKSKPIVVYCFSGGRSANAKAILESNGFTDVTNGGGIGSMPKL